LNTVEVETEGVFEGKTIALSQRMLSTEKAYDSESINAWAKRLIQAAKEAGIEDIVIEATPKLDGFAALDNGKTLATRGDGYRGTDITRVFDHGLQVIGSRGLGPGEIVVDQTYFETHLFEHFDNSRNFQSSVIAEKELNEHTEKAIKEGAVVFYPFSELPRWTGTLSDAIENMEAIVDEMWTSVNYDVDGVVFEAPALREIMGHTSHHHRNTIAFKRNEKPVEVEVKSITFQTGKTGKITPVAELVPTKISGALVSRVTLHNVGWAEKNKIGPGSIVGVVRSGLVIPKVVETIKEASLPLPSACSSCGTTVSRDGDNLMCNGSDCSAQVGSKLEYFFKTLGTCDGFGEKTIDKLVEAGITKVSEIYALNQSDLTQLGFGEKTAQNLLSELKRSIQTEVEDWRFLAAFSLDQIGKGGCERLLSEYPLSTVFSLNNKDIVAVEGFAEKTADLLIQSLDSIKDEYETLVQYRFNLVPTPLKSDKDELDNPIAGKTVVFTGSMQYGSRSDMTKQAKEMGAKVSSSVSKKTDILIIGDNVGATKLNAAKANGVEIITEQDYFDLLTDSELPKP
jgi:DNA ligase (NAD+)